MIEIQKKSFRFYFSVPFWQIVKTMVLLLFVISIWSCEKESVAEDSLKKLEVDVQSGVENKQLVKDQYIVLLSKFPADFKSQAALDAVTKEIRQIPGVEIKGSFKHTVTGFTAKLDLQQVKRLENDPRVISVTQDEYIFLTGEEVNSLVTVQEYPEWGLDRIDQRQSILDRTYAYTSTGAGINVYVMDSGIRFSHNEFEGRATLGKDFVRDFPDDLYDIDDPDIGDGEDCNGHGTHVAGTIGGKTYGVAKDVNLISVRVFSCHSQTSEARVLQAVDWVTANAAHPAVVNISLGKEGVEEPLELAIENSISSGINYVISAGNSNINACEYTPARTPGALTVGASDIYNKRAYFSNYGNCVDVYGPGVSIASAGFEADTATVLKSGTSMAAPHVSGIAAQYLEMHPEATPAQVHAAVVENATPGFIDDVPSGTSALANNSWGTIDFIPPPAPKITLEALLSKSRGDYRVHLNWNTPEGRIYELYRNGMIIGRFEKGPYIFDEFLFEKNATIVYRVCNIEYENCSEEVAVVIGNGGTSGSGNNSPQADFSFSADLLDLEFIDQSSDSDGNITAWSWDFGDGNSSNQQNPQHTYATGGNYEVGLQVTDNLGATSFIAKNISVKGEEMNPGEFLLTGRGYKNKGQWQTDLTWSPAGNYEQVDLYRNGEFLRTIDDTGIYTDSTSFKGGGALTYKICVSSSLEICSNTLSVQF
ncbi:Peptidase inhibitor I9 [Salinimicrobium sediminis]|uniref:Peptidase inhibitor I9 n=2 Tax=Salinimicrobium sediminis TaxID=1343891 RepID=A0A285X7X9_9FLAO|nr:Peptidase inhibitor I9 [Salinimicrobium sediminis]